MYSPFLKNHLKRVRWVKRKFRRLTCRAERVSSEQRKEPDRQHGNDDSPVTVEDVSLRQEAGELVPADAQHTKMHWCYKPAPYSASNGTTFCRVSKCARPTRRSGLFFYSYCGESSRIVDFSCFHASMPGQDMSMY